MVLVHLVLLVSYASEAACICHEKCLKTLRLNVSYHNVQQLLVYIMYLVFVQCVSKT